MSGRSLNGLNSNVRSLNGLEGIGIENIGSGDAINVVSTTGTRTINVKISKQAAAIAIADDDLFCLETAGGTVKKITGANLKTATISSNWTLSGGGDLYPLATGTDVVIGATANSDSRKLLVTGTLEVTSNSYLNTISTGVWNGTRLTSAYVPADIVYDADLLTAVAFSTSQGSAFNIGRGGSSYAYNNTIKGWTITLGETPAADGSDAGSVGSSEINLLCKTGYSANTINLLAVPVYNQGINTTINLTASSRSGGSAAGASNINITANDTSPAHSNGSTITLSAETEVIINSGFKIGSTGTVTSGVWSGTAVAVNKGGTGQTTYTNGQILIGNTTSNTLAKATITGGTNVTVTNGTGTISIAATDTNTTYSAGTNLNLSGTTFNLDAALSSLTTIGMSGKLTGTGYGANGFALCAGNFYSAGTDSGQQIIHLVNQNTNYGFSHSNYYQDGGGSETWTITSDVRTYVNALESSIGNTLNKRFCLYTNNANVMNFNNSTNYWCLIGAGITTSAASAPLHIQTPASNSAGAQLLIEGLHATADASLFMRTNGGSGKSFEISLDGSSGASGGTVNFKNGLGNPAFEVNGSAYGFGNKYAYFKYDSSYTYFYNPTGTNGNSNRVGAYLAYHDNGSAIYLNTPAGGTSAGDYIGFSTGSGSSTGDEVPKGRMEMTGNFQVCGTVTTGSCPCDDRVKEDIKDYSKNATDILKKVRVVDFMRKEIDTLKADEKTGLLIPFAERFSGNTHYEIGVVAQDILKIHEISYIVENSTPISDCCPMSIPNWNALTSLLIKSNQEQQKQIDDLKVIINNLIISKTFKEFKSK